MTFLVMEPMPLWIGKLMLAVVGLAVFAVLVAAIITLIVELTKTND